MSRKRPRQPLAARLAKSLEEGIRHANGEVELKTVEMPQEPPEVDAYTVLRLRRNANMSQAVFARLLNVSTKTVQSWEQGVRKPSHASRRLLQILGKHPEVVRETAGVSAPNRRHIILPVDMADISFAPPDESIPAKRTDRT
ncbi:MAG: helix-turn-helix domain-containing protein [Planctomycetaceae bacterium]